MARLHVLSAAAILILGLVYTAEAIKCYDCLHMTYSSSDSTTQSLLDIAAAYSSNTKCQAHGQDFLDNPTSTTTCSTNCAKVYSTFEMSYFGAEVTGEMWFRGCPDVQDRNNEDGCEYDLATHAKGRTYNGATVTSGTGCGCSDKALCNTGSHVTITSLTLILTAIATALLKF